MLKYIFFAFILITLFLQSCSPMGILTTTTSAGAVVAESERTVGEAIDDVAIKIKIAEKFAKSKSGIFLDVNSTVKLGKVLLTGIVETQEIRIDILCITILISKKNYIIQ